MIRANKNILMVCIKRGMWRKGSSVTKKSNSHLYYTKVGAFCNLIWFFKSNYEKVAYFHRYLTFKNAYIHYSKSYRGANPRPPDLKADTLPLWYKNSAIWPSIGTNNCFCTKSAVSFKRYQGSQNIRHIVSKEEKRVESSFKEQHSLRHMWVKWEEWTTSFGLNWFDRNYK